MNISYIKRKKTPEYIISIKQHSNTELYYIIRNKSVFGMQ